MELDELLCRANCVSLHVPLTPETRHMIDVSQMKDGAILINIGRGGLVDEDALVAALRSGHLAGAALDVTEIEPLPLSSPLLDAPNLILTPHVAWVSEVALEDLRCFTAEAALRLIGARELAVADGPLHPRPRGVSFAAGLARRPDRVARRAAGLAGGLARAAAGSGEGPARGDRRFADPAWTDNPLFSGSSRATSPPGARSTASCRTPGSTSRTSAACASRWRTSTTPPRRATTC